MGLTVCTTGISCSKLPELQIMQGKLHYNEHNRRFTKKFTL
jgi:hypothetical protein